MANDVNIDAMAPVIAVHIGSLRALEQALQSRGADVLALDGTTIVDKDSFMVGVAANLAPSVAPRPRNWDGLNDVLWQVLAGRSAERVALIWTHAEMLMEQCFNDFLMALTVFSDVARAVSTTRNGFPRVMHFQVFLLGDATNFPRLDQ